MKNVKKAKVLSVVLALGVILGTVAGCGAGSQKAEDTKSSETVTASEGETVNVKWLASRPVDGAIDRTIKEIAQKYTSENKNFKLEVETTPDRPAYLQKLRTLIAGNNMPDIIDIDADPYCNELVKQNLLVDVKKFLQDEKLYDLFYPIALKYQEFPDGSMYTLPLEYHVEMTWYNKKIFDTYNLKAPKTMDEFLNVCKTLKEKGITPISVDGVDRWPVMRYLAMIPFRLTGNDYILKLREGKASMQDETGMKAVNFMAEVGKYFNDGFASTDYATAQSLFLKGKAAMYYIGDWEQNAMLDENLSDDMKGNIDYFYLPMVDGATTQANEFCINSGIGMAFNAATFDNKSKPFIKYLINNYGQLYAEKQQMSPMKIELSSDVKYSDLYKRIKNDMDNTGTKFLKPWDTYLDADTNTVMGDNMLLLAMGEMSPEKFAQLIDDTIKVNAPKYFK